MRERGEKQRDRDRQTDRQRQRQRNREIEREGRSVLGGAGEECRERREGEAHDTNKDAV